MHILRVYIDGLNTFDEFNITFNKENNVIIGPNGVGKSNFMNIIRYLMNDNITKLELNRNKDVINASILLKLSDNEKEKIIKYQFMISLICKINTLNHDYEKDIDKINKLYKDTFDNLKEFMIMSKEFSSEYDKRGINNYLVTNNEKEKKNFYEIRNIDFDVGKNNNNNNLAETFPNLIQKLNFLNKNEIEEFINKFKEKGFGSGLIDYFNEEFNKITTLKTVYFASLSENSNKINNILKMILCRLQKSPIDSEYKKIINIQENFKLITNKNFRLIECNNDDDDYDDDYKVNYKIIDEGNPSDGERNLIVLLAMMELNDNNKFLLLDEPTNGFNHAMKKGIEKLIFENKLDQQIIMITHDTELITETTAKSLIYFSRKEEISSSTKSTKSTKSTFIEPNQIKRICEHPSILFMKKVLFVEGYNDVKFFKALFKKEKIDDYTLVSLNGATNKLWEITQEFSISYKIIFDYDKIAIKHSDTTIKNNINIDDVRQNIKDIVIEDDKSIKNFLIKMGNNFLQKDKSKYYYSTKLNEDSTIGEILKKENKFIFTDDTNIKFNDPLSIANICGNKIFVHTEEIENLEGIGVKLGLLTSINQKSNWRSISISDIYDKLKNVNDEYFDKIIEFIKSEFVDIEDKYYKV